MFGVGGSGREISKGRIVPPGANLSDENEDVEVDDEEGMEIN